MKLQNTFQTISKTIQAVYPTLLSNEYLIHRYPMAEI